MSDRIILDDEGTYMAGKLAEYLQLSPQRTARFSFMLTVHQLDASEDPSKLVETIMNLLSESDDILQELPRSIFPHDIAANILTCMERERGADD